MKQLQIFNNPKFGQVRGVEVDGKPYVVGNDIASALEYVRPYEAVTRHCKGAVIHRILTEGGEQDTKVIPEGDIFRLIVKASEQSVNSVIRQRAEEFEKWIFDEVLPSIRKHGMYAKDELLDNPDLLIQVATELKKAREEKKLLEDTIEQQKPQVLFAASVTASSTSILVADLAKILKKNGIDIGEIRLWEWLRKNKYVISEKGRSYNMPTQKSMELKVMEIKEGTYINSKGVSKITKTTLVTGKGQVYFVNKFLKEKEESLCLTR